MPTEFGVRFATQKILQMMENFEIPPNDQFVECMLLPCDGQKTDWDVGVFIHKVTPEDFYTDIFHFWVRAFFSFIENIAMWSMFEGAIRYVDCVEIPPETFRREYFEMLQKYRLDPFFVENQEYLKMPIELENRSFSEAYVLLNSPGIKSAVAYSDDDYVAYFHVQKIKFRS